MVEVGKAYHVIHSRKGEFDLRVTSINGNDWISGTLVSDSHLEMRDWDVYQGDEITIRKTFCRFVEIAEEKKE